MLATAEAGVYSESLLDGVSADMRRRFFEPRCGERDLRVVAAARKMITFRQLNLVESWPMHGQFDAIFCRNVVIYFDEPTQQNIWEKFAPRLRPEGALYIGHSERVTGPAVVASAQRRRFDLPSGRRDQPDEAGPGVDRRRQRLDARAAFARR